MVSIRNWIPDPNTQGHATAWTAYYALDIQIIKLGTPINIPLANMAPEVTSSWQEQVAWFPVHLSYLSVIASSTHYYDHLRNVCVTRKPFWFKNSSSQYADISLKWTIVALELYLGWLWEQKEG